MPEIAWILDIALATKLQILPNIFARIFQMYV